MRLLIVVATGLLAGWSHAGEPFWRKAPGSGHQVVTPRVDLIGPLGNQLPPAHRYRLNRPTYVFGKLDAKIAPSSREAMSWRRSANRGHYACPDLRFVTHYFYSKPWQAIKVGPRESVLRKPGSDQPSLDPPRGIEDLDTEDLGMAQDGELIEEGYGDGVMVPNPTSDEGIDLVDPAQPLESIDLVDPIELDLDGPAGNDR